MAREIERPEKTELHWRPVFSQGIVQQALRCLTRECDVVIRGIAIRLPIGCVISVVGGGAAGIHGSLMTDVDFRALDGTVRRAVRGMGLLIPA